MYDQMQLRPGGAHQSAPPSVPDSERVAIYTQDFANDPHRYYEWMRGRFGSLAPVWIEEGIPATLVLNYKTAVAILHDPVRFPADPRRWQANLPRDRELNIVPMLGWRPNALRNGGEVHRRLRAAANDALADLDITALRPIVEQNAFNLIETFPTDTPVDLIGEYFVPLVFSSVVNHIMGCPDSIGQQIAAASKALFEAQVGQDEVDRMMNGALLELCNLKKAQPSEDLTTYLVRHHENLTDQELIHAQVTNCSAGIEITVNLAANALLVMLTDPRYDQYQTPGQTPPINAAIDEILAKDPPLANLCVTYPASPVPLDEDWLPADEPVIISMAACCRDPEYGADKAALNSAHLAWGGPSQHACPKQAQTASYTIAHDAITQLLDLRPDVQLTVAAQELEWRPGPFHRALAAFPVIAM
ncbi:cytochrome P450 [Nocardia sp. NBC_01329]|uniref:cytochrome P450 n=1 Tax=Nocardia sp. NBC_01329 TaxID=2903594 RepID=UPI002E0E6007|nr:cytochrome P450 [Nocardia sp. NBC_01329]